MSPPIGLADRIEGAWQALSPQEQRVADFLRTRPDESALYNSSELARRTGVSKATVSRLFRRLGFADSRQARDLLRVQRGTGLPVVIADDEDPLAAQVAADVLHLQRLTGDVDPVALTAAAAALAAAPRVVVAGLRSGFPIAMLLRQALVQARPDVLLVPEHGQTLGEELVGLGAEDVVIVVGLRRRPAVLGPVLRALESAAPRTLLIADPSLPPSGGDWRFDVGIESRSPFDSYAAAATLVSLLAGAVLEALGETGAARVAAISAAYETLGELDTR